MDFSDEVSHFNYGIHGIVKKGFEPVIHELERLHEAGQDKRSQLCVYVGEEVVIDVTMNNLESPKDEG